MAADRSVSLWYPLPHERRIVLLLQALLVILVVGSIPAGIILTRPPTPPPEALAIARQCADALVRGQIEEAYELMTPEYQARIERHKFVAMIRPFLKRPMAAGEPYGYQIHCVPGPKKNAFHVIETIDYHGDPLEFMAVLVQTDGEWRVDDISPLIVDKLD
jgi:hypothetical protein